jgi:hypothetical protein
MGSGELNGLSVGANLLGATEPSQPGSGNPSLSPGEITDSPSAWESAWIDLGGEG